MKLGRLERPSGLSRKSKKRTNKKPQTPITDTWCSEDRNDGSEASVPPLDYSGMFWQQPGAIPPHMQPHNGQRLFTAMSDPSVCRYSAVPMAYAMEPISMPPMYPLYRPVPQPNYRPFRGRGRRNIQHHPNLHGVVNGYSSLQENRTTYMTPHLYQNGDYTSLPPTANNEVREQVEEMSSEHRRYSDPGLGPPELENCRSEESDSGESGSSIITVGKNNKLVLSLVEQMTSLRESNSQMFKELHETKLALENVKAELSRVTQQNSLDYQPGMLSDIIGEMRQANKILEETMNARISAIIEEKNNQRLMELEEVKVFRLHSMKSQNFHRGERIEYKIRHLKEQKGKVRHVAHHPKFLQQFFLMTKKSILVYDLLRSERPDDGFTPKEILHRVSQTHGFTPGKGLRRQINAALKRGIDFGILSKQRNRYKYDLNVTPVPIPQAYFPPEKRGKKKRVTKPRTQMNRKSTRRTEHSQGPVKRPKDIRPNPTVPPLPNWTPKKRILREEPISKFKKH
ncbi:uncharacterized protein [Fopius arisanus]|nr:PREDICTED: uncharacterized protein LOC105268618 isoform X2 [Fopius arisanus]